VVALPRRASLWLLLATLLTGACGPSQAINRGLASEREGPPVRDGGDVIVPDQPADSAPTQSPPVLDAPAVDDALDLAKADEAVGGEDTVGQRGVPTGSSATDLEVEYTDVVGSATLTEIGTADWIHWGHGRADASNRKSGVASRITLSLLGDGPVAGYQDRPVRFSWSDGTPTLSVIDTRFGISTGDRSGRGFRISAAGDPSRRSRLRLFVGAWGARARLIARLSSQDTLLHSDDSLDSATTGRDRMYIITFGPLAQTESVVLDWTVMALNRAYGNVTVQAAALEDR
jgi:hypothetical protein